MKIAHLTSVHPRYDTRIFLKECRSLAENGYEVSLVVADGKGDEQKDGIFIYDVGKDSSRIRRMTAATRRVFDKAVELDADLYHFHDPELIRTGLRLQRKGKKVIFDSHEDVALQIRSKPYLPVFIRKLASGLFSRYEYSTCRKFDAIVTATPAIRDKFLQINKNAVDINNFPIPEEFNFGMADRDRKQNVVCYIGGYTLTRGLKEIVRAISMVKNNTRLELGGRFFESAFESEIRSMPGWQLADEKGYLDRKGVREVLQESLAGLVTLHSSPNYLDSLPVKMFEYMSAGIPVIASDFPLWKEIIENNRCGVCVNPEDPQAIAGAIDYVVTHPEEAKQMGNNGRKAVEERYNWTIEEKKLVDLYRHVLGEEPVKS